MLSKTVLKYTAQEDLTLLQPEFLYRFLKVAAVNVVSNVSIPLSGAISVAFLGHLSSISYLAEVENKLIGYCLSLM
jgi:hypothetical protein